MTKLELTHNDLVFTVGPDIIKLVAEKDDDNNFVLRTASGSSPAVSFPTRAEVDIIKEAVQVPQGKDTIAVQTR